MARARLNRGYNTTVRGDDFDDKQKLLVWKKGSKIRDEDPDELRSDICGNVIKYSDYGNTASKYGWEIDHIVPVKHDGKDNLSNLQPLQWKNNRRKRDQLKWNC